MAVASSHPPMQAREGWNSVHGSYQFLTPRDRTFLVFAFHLWQCSTHTLELILWVDLIMGCPTRRIRSVRKNLTRSNECMGLVGANIVDLKLEKIRHNPSWKLYIKTKSDFIQPNHISGQARVEKSGLVNSFDPTLWMIRFTYKQPKQLSATLLHSVSIFQDMYSSTKTMFWVPLCILPPFYRKPTNWVY